MIYSNDAPIKNAEEDLLFRSPLVDRLRDAIAGMAGSESFVIGLDAPWGSGKTSIIELLKQALIKEEKEIRRSCWSKFFICWFKKKFLQQNHDSGSPGCASSWIVCWSKKALQKHYVRSKSVRIVDFNPWSYSKSGDLTRTFFEELGRQLGILGDYELWQQRARRIHLAAEIGKPVVWLLQMTRFLPLLLILYLLIWPIVRWIPAKYFSFLDYLTVSLWVPWAAAALTLILGFVRWLLSIITLRVADQNRHLRGLRTDIAKRFIKRGKTLILLDDLDRLSADELAEILKIVRSNADFPNTVYLLAGDFDIMAKQLDPGFKKQGREFLQKIVHKHIRVPLPGEAEIVQIAASKVRELLAYIGDPRGSTKEDESLIEWLSNHAFPLLKNLRDLNRFMNEFRFYSGIVLTSKGDEVNRQDFAGFLVLRSVESGLFEFMRDNKDAFVSSSDGWLLGSVPDRQVMEEERKKFAGNLERKISGKTKALDLAKELFPRLRFINNTDSYFAAPIDKFAEEREKRICSPFHFETYFRLRNDGTNVLTDAEYRNLLESCYKGKGMVITRKILDEGRIRALFVTIHGRIADPRFFHIKYLGPVLQALVAVSDNFPDDWYSSLTFDTPANDLYIVFILASQRDDLPAPKKDFFMKIFEQSPNLWGPMFILQIDSLSDRRHNMGFNATERASIRNKFAEQLRNETERIKKSRYTGRILAIWKLWDPGSEWRTVLEDLLNNEAGTLHLLQSLMGLSAPAHRNPRHRDFADAIVLLSKEDWIPRLDKYAASSPKIKEYRDAIAELNDSAPYNV